MKLKFSDHVSGNLYEIRGKRRVWGEAAFKKTQDNVAEGYCPNCGGKLTEADRREESVKYVVVFGEVAVCERCGWWSVFKTFIDGDHDFAPITTKVYFSILKKYKISDKNPTLEFLDRELKKKPSAIAKMNKTAFEKYMQDILQEYYGKRVHHVGRSNDGGVDLLMIEDNERTLVQVKNRMLHKSEGSLLVRDLMGAMLQKNTFKGLILSTARHFTVPACRTANEALSHGIVQKIEFKNCNQILEMIDAVSSNREEPWKPVLKKLWGK